MSKAYLKMTERQLKVVKDTMLYCKDRISLLEKSVSRDISHRAAIRTKEEMETEQDKIGNIKLVLRKKELQLNVLRAEFLDATPIEGREEAMEWLNSHYPVPKKADDLLMGMVSKEMLEG